MLIRIINLDGTIETQGYESDHRVAVAKHFTDLVERREINGWYEVPEVREDVVLVD